MKTIRFIRNKAGDMGIGAMIVFIAMVLVAGIAASVLVQTANKLEIKAMTTGQQTTKEVASGLHVMDIEGKVATGQIVNMTITIRARAGSNDIDLNQTILEITDGTTKVLLHYDSSDATNFNTSVNTTGSLFATNSWALSNEHFGIIVLNDADSSMSDASTPVINRGDLVMLTVSCSECFGGFDPRDNIEGTVLPEIGSPGIFAFRVPSSLPDVVYDLY